MSELLSMFAPASHDLIVVMSLDELKSQLVYCESKLECIRQLEGVKEDLITAIFECQDKILRLNGMTGYCNMSLNTSKIYHPET